MPSPSRTPLGATASPLGVTLPPRLWVSAKIKPGEVLGRPATVCMNGVVVSSLMNASGIVTKMVW